MLDNPPPDAQAQDCDATAAGILLCLRMLAEEAAMLKLGYTVTALYRAIQACEAERTLQSPPRAAVH